MKKLLLVLPIVFIAVNAIAMIRDQNEELKNAASANDLPRVIKAIKNGADVNAVGGVGGGAFKAAALHHAIQAVNPEMVTVLIDAGADVNAIYEIPQYAVYTPLITALRRALEDSSVDRAKMTEIIQILLEHGANPNIGFYQGKNAFEMARNINPKLEALLKSSKSKLV